MGLWWVDMDFNKIPRLMADQISMNYSDKVFNGLSLGGAYHGFILLPEAAITHEDAYGAGRGL